MRAVFIKLLLLKMFHALAQNAAHMFIQEGIEDGLAFPAELDKPVLFQDAQLVGYGALGHIQQLCDITDAHFAFQQYIQYLYPG